MKKGGSSVPWKMIFFLAILAVVVFFAGFNITNVSDISFGFYEVIDVPIFISLFIAFFAGALVMIPFVAKKKKSRVGKSRIEAAPKSQEEEEIPEIPAMDESDSPRHQNKTKK